MARTLAQGTCGSPAFIAGSIVGALFWLTLAAAGLAALAGTFGVLFVAVRYAGAAYLLYLAWKLWTSPARPMGASEPTPEGKAAPVQRRARSQPRQPQVDSFLPWPYCRLLLTFTS